MSEIYKFRKPGMQTRAELLAWQFDICPKRVFKILSRCKTKRVGILSTQHCDFLTFSPSLEKALLYLRPEIALKAFEKGEFSLIEDAITALESLVGQNKWDISIEELCHWKAESELYGPPDPSTTLENEDDEY